MEIECTGSFAELEQLKDEWNALEEASAIPGIFMTFEYQKVWWQHFGKGYDLRVLLLRDEGKLRGIAPFYLYQGELTDNETDKPASGEGERILRLVGGWDVSDYVDIICLPDDALAVWQAIAQYLSQQADWDSLDLHNLPAASPTRHLVADWAESQSYSVTEEEEDKVPFIDFPAGGDFESYVASINKKDRHELRRKLRRFEAAFPDAQYATTACPALADDLNDFIALNRQAHGEKQQFMTEPMAAYFSDLAHALCQRGDIRLNYLSVNGKRIASYLAFDQNKTIYLYNTGYDPSYREYSVGLVLAAYFIRDVIQQGYKRFDFMQGTERYKYDLGAQNSEVYHLTVRKNNG